MKIKSAKFVDSEEMVYDIEVDTVDHTFMIGSTRVENCRLLSDTSKLKGFMNSIGGTSLSIGSIKVNTMNLVRIAIETKKEKEDSKISWINAYLKLLRKRTELCCKLLDVQREIITKNVQRGLLPNYIEGGIDINHQYSTVGILGLYETIKEFGFIKTDEFGNKSYTDEGIKLAQAIFDTINDVKDNFTDKYSFNIESVPAERAAVILCQKDNLLYDRNDDFIYSNQWIPLKEKCTIQEKIRLSSVLDKMCSGGAIAHINIESNFPNKDVAWDMLNKIASRGVIYFAFNTKINVCKNHHAFVGTNVCPVCGEDIYGRFTRVVGFLTSTKSWSSDRRREFVDRKWYTASDWKEYADNQPDL